jgi:hypothetical protein
VVVGMRAREEVQHGDFLAVERRLVARPKGSGLRIRWDWCVGANFFRRFPSAGRCWRRRR